MTLATAALVVGGIGTGVQAYGAIQQGQAAKKAAAYNAQVAQNNAKIAEQNANYAIQAGTQKAAMESLRGRAALGKIKAAQAASGINVNTGTAADVQEGAREANVLDTATVLQNAQLQAYGYRSQASNFKSQAGLYDMQGDAAANAGNISALGTLLSGASSLGSKWAAMSPSVSDDPLAGISAGNSLGSATYEKAWGE